MPALSSGGGRQRLPQLLRLSAGIHTRPQPTGRQAGRQAGTQRQHVPTHLLSQPIDVQRVVAAEAPRIHHLKQRLVPRCGLCTHRLTVDRQRKKWKERASVNLVVTCSLKQR